MYTEACPLSQPAFHFHLAALGFDQGLDNKQPQPCSLLLPRGGSPVVFRKKERELLWGNAWSGVAHLDDNPSAIIRALARRDEDLRSRRRKFEGVMHEVGEHPLQRQRIARDQRQLLCGEVQRQDEVTAPGDGAVLFYYLPEDMPRACGVFCNTKLPASTLTRSR